MIKVVAALIEKDNKILIAQRLGGICDDMWEFPGGKLEPGETEEEALIREIKEELDIKIKVSRFINNSIHQYPTMKVDIKLYKAEYLSGDIHLSEHKQIKWVKKEDLLGYNLVPGDIPLAKGIINNM